MSDKRKAVRVRANIVANFKVKAVRLAGGSRVKDISEVGLCLPSKHHFDVNAILELEIRAEDLQEPVKTTARVVWIRNISSSKYNFEVGLEFMDMLPAQKNVIHKFVQGVLSRGESRDVAWMD
jgi:hypothetical protein